MIPVAILHVEGQQNSCAVHVLPNSECVRPDHDRVLLTLMVQSNEPTDESYMCLQVLLQPRCLLVMQDAACNALLHSIQSQPADTISDMCVNAQTAQVEVGQVIHRSRRRMSLVFVHKQHAQWMC